MIEIRHVENRRMLGEFIMLPWTAGIYKDDPAWVPPLIRDQRRLLDRKKGYFFEIGEAELFLAYEEGTPVGRISAHVNHLYEERYDRDTGFFGFFESVNDGEVARSLFDAAASWLRRKGKRIMNGPQSFSIYDSVGFEVEGVEKMPTVGLFHFAPYYKDLAEACGFTKCIDWHCFLVERIHYGRHAPYLEEVKNSLLKDTDVEFKTLGRRDVGKRVKEVQEIFNTAWEGNWGHLPLTDRQLEMIFRGLRMFIIPDFAIFAEKDGKTVGFIISIPDVNPGMRILNGRLYPWRVIRFLREAKQTKRVRTVIMGVLPQYRGQHIDDIFYLKSIEAGLNLDIWESDCSMIAETNEKVINAMKPLTPNPYKTYRIYQKSIA
ncbi:MAG TPA: hypothetical protein PLA83_08200 [Deltaproteobacteria bacterium]|jgi:hypothetical protein|nr:hypothetical protein [Deltaproteobacteria bacterium]HQI02597.1 hypothetical protein [Deltaproteobacteria bacterium]